MQDEMSKSDAMNHLECWQGWPTPANVFQENNFSSTAQKYLVFMQAPGWLEIVHRWRMRNDKSFCIDIISWLLVRWRWYVCANYRQEPGIPIMINIIYMPIADVSTVIIIRDPQENYASTVFPYLLKLLPSLLYALEWESCSGVVNFEKVKCLAK